jgi:hypothetical protein
MYCRNCGYALIGLPVHRCPECGRPFRPDDPRTFLRRDTRLGHRCLLLALSGVAMVVLALVALSFRRYGGPVFHDVLFGVYVVLILLAYGIEMCVLIASLYILWRRRFFLREKVLLVVAMLISAAVVLGPPLLTTFCIVIGRPLVRP